MGHCVDNDQASLARRLTRAQRVLSDCVPYSPSWAAAIEAVEELRLALVRARQARRRVRSWAPRRQLGDRRVVRGQTMGGTPATTGD